MKNKILNEFYEKWNFINTDEEKFLKFKQRINAILTDNLGQKLLNEHVIREIRMLIGTNHIINNSSCNNLVDVFKKTRMKDCKNIYEIMFCEDDIKTYMFYIQIIFLLDSITIEDKSSLYDKLNDVISISGFENVIYLDRVNNKFKVLPVGEKFLDDNLIIETIKSLEEYEESYNLYIVSLQQYTFSENNIVENRDIADKLRLSFEIYLKKRFNSNSQGIGKIVKKEVKEFFNENNVSSLIVNIYHQLANAFEQYSNDESKHNLKEISSEELEYLIYLFGTFIRLIYRIDKKNNNMVKIDKKL